MAVKRPSRKNAGIMPKRKEPTKNAILARKVSKLLEVMRALRSEKGCPWDKKQTHATLKPYLIEECAEFLDAVDENDRDNILEELGDILLHIVFHSQIAHENGNFTFEDVVEAVTNKLIRRHPHVFGEKFADTPDRVIELWQEVKKKEKPDKKKSELDGIPHHFPALFRAEEIQKRAAKFGFDWESSSQIIAKIEEELGELKEALKLSDKKKIEEEIGDLLFSIVNLARFLKGHSAEELLARTTAKFKKRFVYIEQKLAETGRTPAESNINEMDSLWNEAKKKVIKKSEKSKSQNLKKN